MPTQRVNVSSLAYVSNGYDFSASTLLSSVGKSTLGNTNLQMMAL
jgi:hypothetical protein